MIEFATVKSSYDGLTVLSEDPLVGYLDGILGDEDCAYVIETAHDKIERARVSFDGESGVSAGRSGGNCWLRYGDDDRIRSIGEKIAAIVGIPLGNAEAMQVIHYGETQQYKGHYDAYDLSTARGQRCCARGGQRLVTALVYLNDVPEGGGTAFAKLGLEVAAKKGRVAIFHNTAESVVKPHPDSLHAGTPVISGEKWAFNIWFRARPINELQDFEAYPDLASAPEKPNATKGKTKIVLQYQGNRMKALFERAVKQLPSAYPALNRPTVFTYWDTYFGPRPPADGLDADARVLETIDKKFVNPLADKSRLPQMLEAAGAEEWAPRTYRSVEDAVRHCGEAIPVWFVKNAYGTGGKDMSCISGAELAGFDLPRNFVLQEGVQNLALIDGKKFTARIYVLLWDGQVFLFRRGFTVVHGVPYVEGSTDYAVQIDHVGYDKSDGAVTMGQLKNYDGYDTVLERSREMVAALKPVFKEVLSGSDKDRYILLGIDLMVQRSGDIKLIEINSFPNFMHTKEIIDEVNIPFFQASILKMLGGDPEELDRI